MVAILLALLTVGAAANGPAWVAELSDANPAHVDNLHVTIPAGSHVAVAVYDTDAVEPVLPDGMAATVRVVWCELRTVFVGMAEERQATIPMYLPEPKDCPPTGAWVVELEPSEVGEYEVPIKCNANTVTVYLSCIDLQKSDIGYGFYTDFVRYADPKRGREYAEDQARHGTNTFTPYAREVPAEYGVDNKDAGALLAWHIETAISAGLVDARFPLVCLSCGPTAIKDAETHQRGVQWPELVSYNQDEPGLSARDVVAGYAADAHAAGLRSGTAIDGKIALEIGGPLDIWIIHMDSMSADAVTAARAQGKARWLYNCALRGTNAPLERYWTGVYTWAMAPEVCLTWAYMHDPESRIKPDGTWNMTRYYGKAVADADGLPIPTVALEGMADGIVDSRLLQELERRGTPEGNAYLVALKARVPWTFWPDGHGRDYSGYVWDVPDTAVPPVDCAAMRRDVLRLLRRDE